MGTVDRIKARLRSHKIALDQFIQIQDHWDSNPIGFHFSCSNYFGLRAVLERAVGFGRATAFFESIPRGGVAFREVSMPDSLHIALSPAPSASSMIHLDSVSIVEGRGPSGEAIYVANLERLSKHLATDLLHIDQQFRYPW